MSSPISRASSAGAFVGGVAARMGVAAGSAIVDALSAAAAEAMKNPKVGEVAQSVGSTITTLQQYALGAAVGAGIGAAIGLSLGTVLFPVAGTGTGAVVGTVVGGIVGLGVVAVARTLCVGNGIIRRGIKALFSGFVFLIKTIVYIPLKIIEVLLKSIFYFFNFLLSVQNQKGVSDLIKARADATYLTQLDPTIRALSNTPLAGGIAAQAPIMESLAKGSLLSAAQVKSYVALGEHLANAFEHGALVMDDDNKIAGIKVTLPGGAEVTVPSSLHTTRALAWYAKAQAVRHTSLCHEVPAEEVVMDEVQSASAFVLPDRGNKIARYVSAAPSAYVADEGSNSGLTIVGKPQAIEDDGGRLPGQAGRVVVSRLTPQAGNERVAFELQVKLPQSRLLGQRAEGHEGFMWHGLQLISGIGDAINGTFEDVRTFFSPSTVRPNKMVVQTGRSRVNLAIEAAKLSELTIPAEQPLSRDRHVVIADMKRLPLITLLRLFARDETLTETEINPALAKDVGILLGVLKTQEEPYKTLREAVINGLVTDARGDWETEKQRVGQEMVLPSVRTGEEMEAYVEKNKISIQAGIIALRARMLTAGEEAQARPAAAAQSARLMEWIAPPEARQAYASSSAATSVAASNLRAKAARGAKYVGENARTAAFGAAGALVAAVGVGGLVAGAVAVGVGAAVGVSGGLLAGAVVGASGRLVASLFSGSGPAVDERDDHGQAAEVSDDEASDDEAISDE